VSVPFDATVTLSVVVGFFGLTVTLITVLNRFTNAIAARDAKSDERHGHLVDQMKGMQNQVADMDRRLGEPAVLLAQLGVRTAALERDVGRVVTEQERTRERIHEQGNHIVRLQGQLLSPPPREKAS
jgi:hypothetical protein